MTNVLCNLHHLLKLMQCVAFFLVLFFFFSKGLFHWNCLPFSVFLVVVFFVCLFAFVVGGGHGFCDIVKKKILKVGCFVKMFGVKSA